MLISDVDLKNVLGKPSIPFSFEGCSLSVSTDSRTIQEGDLFFSLEGNNFDGHNYITQIIESKKARAIIACERKSHIFENIKESDIPYFLVKDPEQSLLDLAHWYQGLFDCKKIIVTGSNGKTTVKNCLKFSLEQGLSEEKVFVSPLSFNNRIGVAKSLLSLRKNHKIAVFEVGTNHPGEIKKLVDAICPHFAILTNVGESHLEFFKTVENVFLEKTSFLSSFKGTLILNGDDEFFKKIISNNFKLISVGLKNQNKKFKVNKVVYDEFNRASFYLNDFFIQSKLSGEHQILNKLLVFSCCCELGLNSKKIIKALNVFESDEMRNQIIKINQITILNDCYNANPSSMKKSIEILFHSRVQGRKFAVLGPMEELGSLSLKKHFEIGQMIANYKIDYFICIGAGKRIEQYCLGAISSQMSKACVLKYHSVKYAVEEMTKLLKPKDMVLVKASRSSHLEDFSRLLKKYEI